MKFKTKIWMLPISAAAVFLIGCAVSYVVGSRTQATLEQLRTQDYPALDALAKIERGVEQFRLTLQSAAAEGDESKLKEVELIAAQTGRALDVLAGIDGKAADAGAIREPLTAYQASALGATRALLGKGQPGDQLQRMQSSMQALDKALALHTEQAKQAVATGQELASAGVRRNLLVLLGTCVAALLALGTASKLIVASVWRDLGDEPAGLRAAIGRIADGDLSSNQQAADVPGSISATLAAMTARLGATVSLIRSASHSIATATSEIAAGNHDLSTRTEQAAANLQRATAAVSELTGSVGESADAARQADTLAGTASQAAQQGGQVVSGVVHNMSEISGASRRITEIIGVIDGIAFQTNILALNAAVEAARAGEQGRGFGVVAAEVRSLAQRSAQAAKEIKTLIGVASDKVEGGSKLVEEAGQAMQHIVDGVQRVSETIAGISVASGEQHEGIADVNRTVSELDRMTQQNAALVEQSAAAAESLRDQALKLSQAVSIFKLDAAGVVAPVPVSVPVSVPVPVAAAQPAVFRPAAARMPAPAARPVAVPRAAKPTAPAPTAAPTAAQQPAALAAARPATTAADDDDWQSF